MLNLPECCAVCVHSHVSSVSDDWTLCVYPDNTVNREPIHTELTKIRRPQWCPMARAIFISSKGFNL